MQNDPPEFLVVVEQGLQLGSCGVSGAFMVRGISTRRALSFGVCEVRAHV